MTRARRSAPLDDVAVDEFFAAVRRRLRRGALEYGDASFERPVTELIDELAQEALDLAGWGYVLTTRLHRLRALARRVDRHARQRNRTTTTTNRRRRP